MAPLPQRAPLVLTGFSPPPYQDPIFSTIIPVIRYIGVATPGSERSVAGGGGRPSRDPPKCNVDTYDEVGWFRPPKISKDMSTEKPIKRTYFQPRRRGEEIFRHYNPLARKFWLFSWLT